MADGFDPNALLWWQQASSGSKKLSGGPDWAQRWGGWDVRGGSAEGV